MEEAAVAVAAKPVAVVVAKAVAEAVVIAVGCP